MEQLHSSGVSGPSGPQSTWCMQGSRRGCGNTKKIGGPEEAEHQKEEAPQHKVLRLKSVAGTFIFCGDIQNSSEDLFVLNIMVRDGPVGRRPSSGQQGQPTEGTPPTPPLPPIPRCPRRGENTVLRKNVNRVKIHYLPTIHRFKLGG